MKISAYIIAYNEAEKIRDLLIAFYGQMRLSLLIHIALMVPVKLLKN